MPYDTESEGKMPKHIQQKIKQSIVQFYKSKPMTIKEVADKFGVSSPSVIKILNEYHIKRYTKTKLFSPQLNEHYFDNIDSENKAYFLGLLITDGCIHQTKGKQPMIAISLQSRDSYLLNLFLNDIGCNKKVTSDGRGCDEIQVISRPLTEALKQYGISERKSLHTVFPKNLPNNMYSHLLRGIFDGDGSISYYNRPRRKAHVKAVRLCQGNQQFLLDVVDFLQKVCDIAPIHTYREKEHLWSIAYRKDISMIKLIDYLYKDAHIFIKRKKHLCDLVYAESKKYIDGNTEITNNGKKLFVS